MLAAQNGADRVAGDPRLSGDLPDALSLAVQDLYFHLKLLVQHRERVFAQSQVGQFSTGGVGQFYSGANNKPRIACACHCHVSMLFVRTLPKCEGESEPCLHRRGVGESFTFVRRALSALRLTIANTIHMAEANVNAGPARTPTRKKSAITVSPYRSAQNNK